MNNEKQKKNGVKPGPLVLGAVVILAIGCVIFLILNSGRVNPAAAYSLGMVSVDDVMEAAGYEEQNEIWGGRYCRRTDSCHDLL